MANVIWNLKNEKKDFRIWAQGHKELSGKDQNMKTDKVEKTLKEDEAQTCEQAEKL